MTHLAKRARDPSNIILVSILELRKLLDHMGLQVIQFQRDKGLFDKLRGLIYKS